MRAIQIACLAIEASAPTDRQSRVSRALGASRAAWQDAYDIAIAKGQGEARAVRMARVAYKLAMPAMDSHAGIRAAVACVAQGVTLEVFDGRDGSQLLYAAQVAITILNNKGGKP